MYSPSNESLVIACSMSSGFMSTCPEAISKRLTAYTHLPITQVSKNLEPGDSSEEEIVHLCPRRLRPESSLRKLTIMPVKEYDIMKLVPITCSIMEGEPRLL
jgi:hypothetical protein